MNEITVVEVVPQLVLGMRKKGGYEEISNMLPRLFEFAVANNLTIVGPPLFVCHEMTVEEAEKAHREGSADVEVAIPILVKGDETEKIKFYELPGGNMAKIVHKGPYEECGPYYEKLFEWTLKNDKKIVGPTREVYLNDPREVPPEDILTEIYTPID